MATFNPSKDAATMYYLLHSAEMVRTFARQAHTNESREKALKLASELATQAFKMHDPNARITLTIDA